MKKLFKIVNRTSGYGGGGGGWGEGGNFGPAKKLLYCKVLGSVAVILITHQPPPPSAPKKPAENVQIVLI